MTNGQVKSLGLRSVHYDAEKKILEVTLHVGDVYQYYDVPAIVYEELTLAELPEQYFDRYIRLRYRHRRMIQI